MAADLSTASRAEVQTLYASVVKLEIALRQIVDGSGSPARPGRFTEAQVNTLADAVETALTAIAGA
jgi:hypothetical protein